jgi:hypothetical protein
VVPLAVKGVPLHRNGPHLRVADTHAGRVRGGVQDRVDWTGQCCALLRLPAQATGQSAKMVNKASMYWSLSSHSKHTDASARLIDFFLTNPAAAKILLTERGIPAIPAVQRRSIRCWIRNPRWRSSSRSPSRRSSCRRPRSPRATPPASAKSSRWLAPTCFSAGPAQRTARTRCPRSSRV